MFCYDVDALKPYDGFPLTASSVVEFCVLPELLQYFYCLASYYKYRFFLCLLAL